MKNEGKLVARIDILHLGRMYSAGEELPVNDSEMVNLWLEAGTAKRILKEDSATMETGTEENTDETRAEEAEDIVAEEDAEEIKTEAAAEENEKEATTETKVAVKKETKKPSQKQQFGRKK